MMTASEPVGVSKIPVVFNREYLSQELLIEMQPLFEQHYQEIAPYKDIILKVNRPQYENMEKLGMIRAFIARDQETDEIIGYTIFFVNHSLNYMDSLQAVQNVIYIKKERRGFGIDFINWCDQYLKQEGVDCVCHRFKADNDFGPALASLGYQKMDISYVRRLQKSVEV